MPEQHGKEDRLDKGDLSGSCEVRLRIFEELFTVTEQMIDRRKKKLSDLFARNMLHIRTSKIKLIFLRAQPHFLAILSSAFLKKSTKNQRFLASDL
jgi:hypothetical protein